MAFTAINLDAANTGDGDTLRAGGTIINNNFAVAVEGPASAVDNRLVVFNGTSGKLVDDGEVTTAQQLRSTLTSLGNTSPINVDFTTSMLATTTALASNMTFTGSNYAVGRSVLVRVLNGGSSRNFTFPAAWVFVGAKPTSIAASKTALLHLRCFGANEADVVAAYLVEP